LPALAAGGSATSAVPNEDYAAVAFNVLAPGQSGSLELNPNSSDQLKLYDALTARGAGVSASHLPRYFKPAWFRLRGTRSVRVERPRAGVAITWDGWGVPHVEGRTQADVAFGAGWATAADRGLLLQAIRGPGRLAALDVPGIDPLAVIGQQFSPSPATEAFLTAQTRLLEAAGKKGREVLAAIDAYVAGINANFRSRSIGGSPWTRNDTYAAAALFAWQFGRGGGDEARRSQFLAALQARLGPRRGRDIFDDLRLRLDPESSASAQRYRPGSIATESRSGIVLDDASFAPTGPGIVPAAPARRSMSSALVVSARRSSTGHPLFVAGPQVGFAYPAVLTELDLHGGGVDVRGIAYPGTYGVVIGRGKDFAWSAQSAHSDIVDHYVETLCGDDTHYRFQGTCRAMETFEAGALGVNRVAFRTTVHGPVVGYATVGGRRVAISAKRSSRGREALASLAVHDLNRNVVRSARDFVRAMNQVELALNWVYADDRDIAFFSSARLPLRAAGTDPGLPTDGSGPGEWRGFARPSAHVQSINPRWGYIAAWNNRPGPGYPAADETWNWGSIQRVDLLRAGLEARRKHTPASVVGAMNVAATKDLRASRVWSTIAAVLTTGPAPTIRAQRMADILDSWWQAGGSRLDRNGDGKIDDPGAAILDVAWPKLADAVLRPVLGPLLPRLAELEPRDDAPDSQGSAYDAGWYSYVQKDLRLLLRRQVRKPFHARYCGLGNVPACRTALWAALEEAGAELEAAQGADPSRWRADATRERIAFTGGSLPTAMRFANRPTFQQVMSFNRHRPRTR
jgi:acyl-homoserine lactone acylase PvdQ